MNQFSDLALECHNAPVGTRILEGRIFKALHEVEGDVWHDFGDDVWHRRDPEDTAAWDGPAPYTTSVDAAMAMRFGRIRIASLREHVLTDGSVGDPAWREWGCTLEVPEIGRVVEFSAHTAALAVAGAILEVHALLKG